MAHKLVWDKTKLDCCRSKLSENLIDLDLFIDRVVHENVNIDNGVKILVSLAKVKRLKSVTA